MTGTIIVVTFIYYLASRGLGLGLAYFGLYLPWLAMLLPGFIAGLIGAFQFVRTEKSGMRVGTRLSCAFKSCAAIVLAPLIVQLALMVVSIISAGFFALPILPDIAAMLTAAALIQMLILIVIALPAIFIGLTLGQRLYYHAVLR